MAVPETTFVFVGLVALTATIGFFADVRWLSDEKRVLFGFIAALLWAEWGFFAYEVAKGTSVKIIYRMDAIAITGFLLALALFALFTVKALELLSDGE